MTRNINRALWIGLFPLLQGCPSQGGQDCTELGCDDEGAILYFGRTEIAWAVDTWTEYRFTVTVDGVELTCTATIGLEPSCDDGLDLWTSGSGRHLEALLLDGYPGATQVVIERDGVVVFDDDYDIVETVYYPNGSSCPDECRFWSGEATW